VLRATLCGDKLLDPHADADVLAERGQPASASDSTPIVRFPGDTARCSHNSTSAGAPVLTAHRPRSAASSAATCCASSRSASAHRLDGRGQPNSRSPSTASSRAPRTSWPTRDGPSSRCSSQVSCSARTSPMSARPAARAATTSRPSTASGSPAPCGRPAWSSTPALRRHLPTVEWRRLRPRSAVASRRGPPRARRAATIRPPAPRSTIAEEDRSCVVVPRGARPRRSRPRPRGQPRRRHGHRWPGAVRGQRAAAAQRAQAPGVCERWTMAALAALNSAPGCIEARTSVARAAGLAARPAAPKDRCCRMRVRSVGLVPGLAELDAARPPASGWNPAQGAQGPV
jgi:hypothetical protein